MTLDGILRWMDAVHPGAYTPEQRTVWINDLEAVVWREILLQPPGQRRPLDARRDGGRRLLLPDDWRRLYEAWLTAMGDFANGEYDRYANSMTMYNACIAELGAWYAAAYRPAERPAKWARLGAAAYTALADGVRLPSPPPGSAVLAITCAVREAFDADGTLTLCDSAGREWMKVDIISNRADVERQDSLLLADAAGDRLTLRFDGGAASGGAAEIRALIQPPAAR